MDAATFRWVLVVIAVLLALAFYFYGKYQARLRRRNAIDTFTREEIDSAFVEDEQLRTELSNLNEILHDNELEENLDDIEIDTALDEHPTPITLPDPQIHVHPEISSRDAERLINYQLRHEDFRLITGEEAEGARRQVGLELDAQGLLEYREADALAFRIASLSAPGDFADIGTSKFSTLGFNCFIDLDDCENPRGAYEALLKKIDELVRILNVKVYKSSEELLTINDVTSARKKLLD